MVSRRGGRPRVTAVEWRVLGLLRQWWHQPDHFDWLSVYVKTRGMHLMWRAGIATVCAMTAALPVALLASSSHPHGAFAGVVAPFVTVVGTMLALLWLTRWPTRRQSIAFSLIATSCVAATCLVQGDPRAGILGCTAFAMLGGYIAFFHTAGHMVFSFGVAMITTFILAARLVRVYDVVLALCAFAMIFMLNLAFTFAAQSLVHALSIDVRRANLDALTGLLNRRGFYQAAHALQARRREPQTYLGVAMIDLDKFKRLNDTHGHAVGDQALVEVGNVLRDNCRATSVIGRAGGEEFVVADTFSTPDLSSMAERLRRAIAAIPYPITASIGTASAALGEPSQVSERRLLDRLVTSADTAMYAAKRAGGNQIRSASFPDVDQNSTGSFS
jgi:diguanylate cyclase (GGDEF)-like protein